MNSDADVKRLVEAARNLIHLNEEGRKTASSFRSAEEWFNTQKRCEEELSIALAPFASERVAPAPDVPPDGTWWSLNGYGHYRIHRGHFQHMHNLNWADMNKHAIREFREEMGRFTEHPPAPSPSLPTPEDVAEMTTVVTCGDRIALIGNTPIDAAKFVEDQMKAGSWGYTVHLIPQSLCRCIIIAERDHAAVTATLRAEVERLEQLRKDYAAVNQDLRATIASLEAKLAAGGGVEEADYFVVRSTLPFIRIECQTLVLAGEVAAACTRDFPSAAPFVIELHHKTMLLSATAALAAKGGERGE